MATTRTHRQQLDSDELAALRAGIAGTVMTPSDAEYDSARELASFLFDRRPAAIVRCEGTSDIAFGVRFAIDHGITFAVRSGGHSVRGESMVDGGIVLDLGAMKGIVIDPIARTAVVQPGVTSDDLGPQAAKFGLALSTGDTGSVGIGGLTVGGGIGWLSRKFGLTVDSLLAATVVTASGEVVRASEDSHPDLFWALRGGGSNFGIVSEFTFRLAPAGTILGGVLVLPAMREVLRGYIDYTPEAPEDLTTIAFMMAAPPAPFIPEEMVGTPVVMVGVTWTGPEDGLEAALAPLRALAEPIADTVERIPYPAIFAYTAEATQRHGATLQTCFAQDFSDEQLDAMVHAIHHATSPVSEVQLRGLGGAISRVAAGATAFPHRDARLMASAIAIWLDPSEATEPHRRWTDDLWAKIAPASTGAYVNFVQQDVQARMGESYLGALPRLRAVKATYDPENVFRFNANIAAE